MDFFCRNMADESSPSQNDIIRCPFLRNIDEPTNFSFSTSMAFPSPAPGTKGPVFEDGPNFDMAFRLFHGENGVVPLSEGSLQFPQKVKVEAVSHQFNPLAAKAATISLASFGRSFGFDAFNEMFKNQQRKHKSNKKDYSQSGDSNHEATGEECPIAKSYRAVSNVIPLVAKAFKPPSGIKYKCPPAIVAARVALARTAFAKNLRPRPLPAKFSSRGTKRIVIEKDPYLLDKALSFFFNSIGAVPRSLGIPQGVTVDSRLLEAASISLSPFGGSNFGYDTFYGTINKPNKYQIVHTKPGSYQPLKSNRVAASNFQPIVAEASSNTCWPAIRAAGVAITNGAKKFITHPVLIQVLMFGIITGVAGFSLGMWQGHPHDSSPPWLTAVLVTLPFIPIFCASILMPNVSIAFMIVPSVLGQVLGSMAVQSCLKSKPLPVTETSPTAAKTSVGVSDPVGVEPPVVTSAVGASDRAGVNNDYKVPILGCNSFVADNGSSNNFNF